MLARILFWIAAAITVLMPLWGQAQTCTLGPYCSSTCTGGSVQTLSQINTAVNLAADGAVACLQRGQIWSATDGVTLTTSHPNGSRLTICASDTTSCTDSGAANPRISITTQAGGCFSWSGTGGHSIRSIDCYDTAASLVSGNIAFNLMNGAHDITVTGSVIDTFFTGLFTNTGTPPNNIVFGTCAAQVTIQGTPANSFTDLRPAQYGALTDSSIAVIIPSSWAGHHPSGQDHLLDLATNGAYTAGSNNLTIECSDFNPGNVGAFIKANRGQNGIIRDSTFRTTGCTTRPGIGFDSHNDGPVEGWIGMQIYRNHFINSHIQIGIGENVDVFNNVSETCAADFNRGFVQIWYTADSDDLQVQNIHTFNNTLYRTGNSGSDSNGYAIISENPPQFSGRVTATGLTLFNNLFYDTDSGFAKIWDMPHAGCSNYGTNGANIKNNFIYTPNDSTPSLWSACSGASGNSTTFNTAPGVANAGAGNFTVTGASAVCTFTAAAGTPTTDFTAGTRTDECIGSYDVVTGGPSETPQPRGAPSGRFTMSALDRRRSLLASNPEAP